MKGCQLFVSDNCLGLVELIPHFYPDAKWQSCIVHWYRNILSKVPSSKKRAVAKMLKAIHAQEDLISATGKAMDVVQKLTGMRVSDASRIVENSFRETLSYYGFPEEHWIRIRTNNLLERVNKEIKRRTKVVGAFPDGRSALMLAAARLRHIAGTRWGTRKYLRMERLYERDLNAEMNLA